MEGGLTKQKKYMSSKDLYFLPNIKEIKLHTNKSRLIDQQSFISKFRSIEDVIENKTINYTKIDLSTIIYSTKNQGQIKSNLYNKYEYLPKIYLKKIKNHDNKKEENKSKRSNVEENIQKVCESLIVQQQNGSVFGKQNSSNFNDFFYKQHFKQKLQREVDKIKFSLNYDFSNKTMLLHDNLVTDRENIEPTKKKYTRIVTLEKQNTDDIKQLQKVPSFLMKILDPPRPTHLLVDK